MRHIIIYARGKLLEKSIKKINWGEITAIADKTALKNEVFNGIPVIHPDCIEQYQYDYIAVFSNYYYQEIHAELVGNYFVPAERIISWRVIAGVETYKSEFADFLCGYMKSDNFKYVLDCDASQLCQSFLAKEELGENIVRLDTIGQYGFSVFDHLYDNIYTNLNEVDFAQYDLAIMWKIPEQAEMICQILSKARNCLILMDYSEMISWNLRKKIELLQKYGSVRVLKNEVGCFLNIKRKNIENAGCSCIYVVTHKEYNVLKDDIYKPICVGNTYLNESFLVESRGENISFLNEKINECTALYWIWKNTKSDYVGLNHYRRYLCDNKMRICGNFLCKETIQDKLKEYDILLPNINRADRLLDEIKRSINDEKAFAIGFQLIRNGIQIQQPKYLDAFDDVMNGQREFICNLFVTKRYIFDSYCEWLFSFLIDAANQMDVSQHNGSAKRTIGFFAERLLTVWLFEQNLKIKELPILMLA